MDYNYILQLLDKYWRGDTSLEEEDILHIFFSQSDIPNELEEYRSYFDFGRRERESVHLGADFDARMLAIVGESAKGSAARQSFKVRLMPLFRAVAVVVVTLALSDVAQMSFRKATPEPLMEQPSNVGTTASMSGDSITTDSMRQSSLTTIVKPSELEIATKD